MFCCMGHFDSLVNPTDPYSEKCIIDLQLHVLGEILSVTSHNMQLRHTTCSYVTQHAVTSHNM